MSIYDQGLNTQAFTYQCGKCGGSDYYVGAQTMSQGQKNMITKNVQVAMCRNCDIQMLATRTKKAEKALKLLFAVPVIIVVIGIAIWAAVITP